MKTENIKLTLLEPNKGQIEGLPANPRQITEERFEALKRDITSYPEMLEYRSLLVYQQGEKYVIIGGNMRYEALKALNYTEAPCVVIPDSTTIEKLQAYTLLDNNELGRWDWDLLANEWDESLLKDIGMDTSFFLAHQFDFENVDELNEENYKEPSKRYLRCPHCGHIDTTTHFVKVEGNEEDIRLEKESEDL